MLFDGYVRLNPLLFKNLAGRVYHLLLQLIRPLPCCPGHSNEHIAPLFG